MKKKIKILEKDLYPPIRDYFEEQGYKVHAEVRDCDMTASKEDELVIIELKRTLNLELLIQAAKRQRISEKVYIAVPKPEFSIFTKKWRDMIYIIRRLELGLIIVDFRPDYGLPNVILEPAPFDRVRSMRQNSRRRKIVRNEIDGRHHNYNTGGSTKTKLMTAYKENSVHIACCLKKFGKMSPAALRECGTGKKTQSILRNNFYGWFEKTGKGIYKLAKKGRKVFKDFPELVEYYNGIIEK